MKQMVDLKEIKIKIEPKIYPIGQRGTIITKDLVEYIAKELKAKELITNSYFKSPDWCLNNMLIDDTWLILNAYYDTGTNEIILQLIKRNEADCRFGLTDCIYAKSDNCKCCTDADFYDDECK